MGLLNTEIKKRIEMINRGEVPEGYKKTKIGIIPEDWEAKTLSDINTITTGSTPSRSNNKYFNGSIPWVKTTDLNNSYIFDTEEKITELALKETSIKYVEENSILVAMYGGFNQIGRTGLMKIRGTTNQAISSFLVDEVNYNSEYVLQWLNYSRNLWRKFAASSRKDPNITKKDVEKFPIAKLNYLEQKAIAQILSAWDKAIELKEQLIEEKKERKKGLMQRLLTGELRLPGFGREEAKKTRLKGYIKEIKRKNTKEKINKILSVTNTNGFIEQHEQFDKRVASSNLSNYKIIEKGEFAYNPSRINVGSIDLLRNYEAGVLSPMYIVFKTEKEKLLPEYLYQYVKSDEFYAQIKSFLQGSVRQSLSFKALEMIRLFIPKSLKEQEAIARLLSTADKEIELLEEELEQLKLQKKGLMQLLLTGIIRVKC